MPIMFIYMLKLLIIIPDMSFDYNERHYLGLSLIVIELVNFIDTRKIVTS